MLYGGGMPAVAATMALSGGQRFCADGFLYSSSLKSRMGMVLVGIPLDVGHAMVAVVAQGRIVVVGQQLD